MGASEFTSEEELGAMRAGIETMSDSDFLALQLPEMQAQQRQLSYLDGLAMGIMIDRLQTIIGYLKTQGR